MTHVPHESDVAHVAPKLIGWIGMCEDCGKVHFWPEYAKEPETNVSYAQCERCDGAMFSLDTLMKRR